MASTARMCHKFKQLHFQQHFTNTHINFIKTCLAKNLTPTFAKIYRNSHIKEETRNKLQRKTLKQELRKHYAKLNEIDTNRYLVFKELTHVLNYAEIDNLIFKINNEVQIATNNLAYRQKLKLKNLEASKINSIKQMAKHKTTITKTHNFYDKFTNLSQTNFNTDEITLLNKGHKYAPKIIPTNLHMLAIDCEVAIESIKDQKQKDDIKNEIIATLTQAQRHKFKLNNLIDKHESQIIKNIKTKITNNNLTCCLADKGAGIIIIETNEYHKKVNEFITNNKYIKIKKDPTNAIQKKTTDIIKNTSATLNKYNYNNRNLKVMNASIPNLYGQIKLHKLEKSIRPVVANYTSPTSKLDKAITNIITKELMYIPNHTINDSIELTRELNGLAVTETHILASFDIVNLYANVPILETIDALKQILLEICHDNEDRQNIANIVKHNLEQNFCQFNNEIYKLEDGIPMGSPSSKFLADIILNKIENKHILNTKNPYCKYITKWLRYVDDTLIIWNGSLQQIREFHNYLNNLHPTIKFTLEIENNQRINFLDLTIIKDTNNNKLNYEIYRKPTNSGTIIPYQSQHDYKQKLSSFHALINRAFKIPMDDDKRQIELNIIKQLANENGFPMKQINNIIKKQKIRTNFSNLIDTQSTELLNDKTYRKINFYNNNINNAIRNTLKKQKIIPVYKCTHTLKNILNNAKPKTNILNKSGVYSISCDDCGATYIGETGRKLETRLKEHTRKNNLSSNFYKHLLFNNHTFNIENNNFKILHTTNSKTKKQEILEMLEIERYRKHGDSECLNDHIQLVTKPIFQSLKI
jgi:hypothetical protein